MTDLKIKTKTIHAVDAYDLEDFIQDTYGVAGYSFQADQEAGDDSQHEFKVDGVLDDWDQEKVDQTLAGDYDSLVTGALLNDMARAGLIPTGDYLISLY